MWNCRVRNISLVRRIEEYDGSVFQGVVHPILELRPACRRPSWVIGRAEVNNIDWLLRRIRNESVARSAWKINQAAISSGIIRKSRVSRHDIGVDVNRVDWIADRNPVLSTKN